MLVKFDVSSILNIFRLIKQPNVAFVFLFAYASRVLHVVIREEALQLPGNLLAVRRLLLRGEAVLGLARHLVHYFALRPILFLKLDVQLPLLFGREVLADHLDEAVVVLETGRVLLYVEFVRNDAFFAQF